MAPGRSGLYDFGDAMLVIMTLRKALDEKAP